MTQLTISDSSNIANADYDGAGGILTIQFQNGGIYEYTDVSQEEAEAFARADSAGKYFHAHIRNVKPYRRVG